MPKISFVMPAKNRGAIISQAINTVIDQTIKDWELIVVDDHSEPGDQTAQVVASFKDKRIRYERIPDKWGVGQANARNFGNMLAKSAIIAVADSDDWNAPRRAELTIEAFVKTGCDVFYGQFDILDKKTGRVRERSAEFPVKEFDLETMKRYNLIPHGSSAYKREIAYEFPYNSFFLRGSDYDLFVRLGLAGKKFYYCPEKVFRYILHDSNISGGGRAVGYDELIRLNWGWSKDKREEVVASILR